MATITKNMQVTAGNANASVTAQVTDSMPGVPCPGPGGYTYKGLRYVPVFADPIEWNSANSYEALTIVIHEGNSYTSKQAVPVGIDIANDSFWALTGNYNAQVEQYRQEVKELGQEVEVISNTHIKEFTTFTGINEAYLVDGDVIKTLGYSIVGTGSGYYKVSMVKPSDGYTIKLEKYYYTLVGNTVSLEAAGANKTDPVDIMLNSLLQNYNTVMIEDYGYQVSSPITIPNYTELWCAEIPLNYKHLTWVGTDTVTAVVSCAYANSTVPYLIPSSDSHGAKVTNLRLDANGHAVGISLSHMCDFCCVDNVRVWNAHTGVFCAAAWFGNHGQIFVHDCNCGFAFGACIDDINGNSFVEYNITITDRSTNSCKFEQITAYNCKNSFYFTNFSNCNVELLNIENFTSIYGMYVRVAPSFFQNIRIEGTPENSYSFYLNEFNNNTIQIGTLACNTYWANRRITINTINALSKETPVLFKCAYIYRPFVLNMQNYSFDPNNTDAIPALSKCYGSVSHNWSEITGDKLTLPLNTRTYILIVSTGVGYNVSTAPVLSISQSGIPNVDLELPLAMAAAETKIMTIDAMTSTKLPLNALAYFTDTLESCPVFVSFMEI